MDVHRDVRAKGVRPDQTQNYLSHIVHRQHEPDADLLGQSRCLATIQ